MKKILLKILTGVFLSVLLIALMVPVFVDVNRYKPEISTLVRDKTGLTLDIQGDINLSVLSGIELSVDRVSLSNGDKLIADIDSLSLNLTPASLYSGSLHITSMKINARSLNIFIDKKGRSNFVKSSTDASDSKTSGPGYFKTVFVEDIVLTLQALNYQNHQTGDSVFLENIQAELSLLPIIDQYQRVIDRPEVIVNYRQSGKLRVQNIQLPRQRFTNVQLSFNNNKGNLVTDNFSFVYEQNKQTGQDVQTSPLTFKMNNKLKLVLAYPESDSIETSWLKPEHASIELPTADISELKLIHGGFVFDAAILHLVVDRQDLYVGGQSELANLSIQSMRLSGDKIKIRTPGKRHYSSSHVELDLQNFPVLQNGKYLEALSEAFLKQFSKQGKFRLDSSSLLGEKVKLDNFIMLAEGKQNEIVLSKLTVNAMDSLLDAKGKIFWDNNRTRWQFNINSQKLNIESFSRLLETGGVLKGYVTLDNNLSGSIKNTRFSILEGKVLLNGKELLLNGFDLNKVLNDFQNSQSVGLLDVGAIALLGPAGVLVTKGNDYRKLMNSVANKGSTKIKQLHSEIAFSNGIATLKDVAFSTDKYRLAIRGKIDTINDRFIDFNVATVDKYGCPVYKEQVRGKLSSPRVKEVNVLVSSVVNPIQSVLSKAGQAIDIHCDKPFYSGAVKPPVQ